jgi:acetyl/propionyl-CoA carboxylase alpha subunit
MSRALGEYHVLGIRTTLPFFVWLMRQPEYVQGRYDTTWLDRLLAGRAGESFSTLSEDEEALAAVAAALDAYMRVTAVPNGSGNAVARTRWLDAARLEALR